MAFGSVRMSGHRVSIVEGMLQSGIDHFGNHRFNDFHVTMYRSHCFWAHYLNGHNVCDSEYATQLIFQRMAQGMWCMNQVHSPQRRSLKIQKCYHLLSEELCGAL